MMVFTTAWQIIVKLLSPILSKPMKHDWATVSSEPEKMEMETTDIKKVDSGLWKIVEAMNPASINERNDRTSPIAHSKIDPATITLRMFSFEFVAL